MLRRRVKRPPCVGSTANLIGAVAGRFRRLFAAILMVKPETVIKWDRAGWRLLWRWRARRSPGRPPIDADLRARIRRMWRDNPTWGENRIAGSWPSSDIATTSTRDSHHCNSSHGGSSPSLRLRGCGRGITTADGCSATYVRSDLLRRTVGERDEEPTRVLRAYGQSTPEPNRSCLLRRGAWRSQNSHAPSPQWA